MVSRYTHTHIFQHYISQYFTNQYCPITSTALRMTGHWSESVLDMQIGLVLWVAGLSLLTSDLKLVRIMSYWRSCISCHNYKQKIWKWGGFFSWSFSTKIMCVCVYIHDFGRETSYTYIYIYIYIYVCVCVYVYLCVFCMWVAYPLYHKLEVTFLSILG